MLFLREQDKMQISSIPARLSKDNPYVALCGPRVDLLNYYFDNKIDDRYEIQKNLVSLNTLARAYSKYTNPELSKKYRDLFENNYSRNSVN